MRQSLEQPRFSHPQAHQSQQGFQRFYVMMGMSKISFLNTEAQPDLENFIIYRFQSPAVSTISNPYEGLKPDAQLETIIYAGKFQLLVIPMRD